MNIVAINKRTGKVFESLLYDDEDQKEAIKTGMEADAESGGIEIEFTEMNHDELIAAISS